MKEKKTKLQTLLSAVTAACCMIALLPALVATAANDVYVNGEVLSGGLSNAYVRGAGDAVQLGTDRVYVRTGSGLVQIGGSASVPEGDPEHLDVTGTLNLQYGKVRVGLEYNPGLDYANLENYVGSGYLLGYYDSSRIFHTLASTTETEITMVPDVNTVTKGGNVGCFHVRLPGSYSSYEAAQSAAGAYSDGFVGWYNGSYYALYGNFETREDAQAAASGGGEAFTASNRCVVVTRTSDAKILFEFDGGESMSLAVSPGGGAADAETWFKGHTYRGGFEYSRHEGASKLTVVNVVDIEDYVKGVLPYEMSSNWPPEALKAQAVCARTYVASHFNGYRSAYGFDVTDDTYSQVYNGTSTATAETNSAADATAGLYITYQGRPIDAMYYSSNGGASESSENVMYSAVAYLRGKTDPYEQAAAGINSLSSWTRTLSASAVTSAVNASGYSLGTVTDISTELSESGNVIGITFTDASGRSATFSKSACYNFVTGSLGLYSIHFDVAAASGGFIFSGGGWGHSVGMSQYGAYAMADSYGFTFDQIINFYYTGVELSRGA